VTTGVQASVDAGSALTTAVRAQYPPVVAAGGARFSLADGRVVTDLVGQTLNLPLGQSSPPVTEAVLAQARVAQFASSRFGTPVFVDLARRLATLAPPGLDRVALKLSNGSDAVETALKMAMLHTRRERVGVLPGAWHGESYLTLGLATSHQGRLVAAAGHLAADTPRFGALARLVRARGDLAAAVIDPALVSNGLPAGGLAEVRAGLGELRAACDDTGTLLVHDEIQTFGGWLGSALFASDAADVTPDVICLGKALGAGYPLAAVVCRRDLGGLLQYNDAEFTFGGHPVSCAAALAALDQYAALRDGLDGRAARFADLLGTAFPAVHYEVRRVGLIATVTVAGQRLREVWTRRVVAACMDHGLFVRPTDAGRRVLLKPPLVLPVDDLAEVLADAGRLAEHVRTGLDRVHPASVPLPRQGDGDQRELLLRAPSRDAHGIGEDAALAAAFDLTLVGRTADEQEAFSRRLRAVGVPALIAYAVPGEDAVDYDDLHGRDLATILADGATSDDLLNGLAMRYYEAVVTAHDQGLLIGRRDASHAVVTGHADLHLIGFDSRYDGPHDTAALFEEALCVLHLLAAVPAGRTLRADLARRLLAAVARRHGRERTGDAWRRFASYYFVAAPRAGRPASPAYTATLNLALASLLSDAP
jgi:4-aminobutyrate aminotransferase-like enzyme